MSKLRYPSAGQRVVCIRTDWKSRWPAEGLVLPQLKQVYTIARIAELGGYTYLGFSEIAEFQHCAAGVLRNCWFHKSFFKPVAETNISDLLLLQNPSPHDVGRINRYDAATRDRWRAPSREKEGV
jgi:hypothetical protein